MVTITILRKIPTISKVLFSHCLVYFQFISWTPNEIFYTMLEKDGKILAKTMTATGILIQVMNYSSNFFVYKYLKWNE